ncbi:hypothetical protein [Clostridium magnum]|uniref:Uncharacterized protein n=1 Tax=Clostridium magnum DSM 2767 TaxID=1121326 RepID=A0A161WQK2_9CLOT|nr:hypothetical protein [Clostridium magnum]KZL88918.1 hypothetical protein CLMAG_58220 [Clostridium magnum DSM 2767]SHI53369.1 hypothetical protein SAMN02745944_04469 [Clostridium magnum DSM 2767]
MTIEDLYWLIYGVARSFVKGDLVFLPIAIAIIGYIIYKKTTKRAYLYTGLSILIC